MTHLDYAAKARRLEAEGRCREAGRAWQDAASLALRTVTDPRGCCSMVEHYEAMADIAWSHGQISASAFRWYRYRSRLLDTGIKSHGHTSTVRLTKSAAPAAICLAILRRTLLWDCPTACPPPLLARAWARLAGLRSR